MYKYLVFKVKKRIISDNFSRDQLFIGTSYMVHPYVRFHSVVKLTCFIFPPTGGFSLEIMM